MSDRRWFVLLVVGVLCCCQLAWSQASRSSRKWTSAKGDRSLDAEFVDLRGDKVVLRGANGGTIELPLNQLSAADRTYAQEQAAKKSTPKEEKKNSRPVPSSKSKNAKASKSSRSTKSLPTGLATGEWPQWRGPNRDGISTETGLLDSWPEDGPPLLWKAGGLGNGFSSVAVAQGKIFTMGRFGRTEKLIALDVNDGSQLWATDAGTGSGQRGPNSTPTVSGDLVFGVTFDGDLLCAETETGREIWRKSFPRDFGGKMMSGWGYSESVLVDGDRVICTPGSAQAMLAALDRRTGKVIWTTAVSPASGGDRGAAYSSVVISHAGGTKQYVQLVGAGVIGVDATNGELLWGYNEIANGTANIPTPIVSNDYVFCSTGYGDGGTALLRISGQRGRISPQEVYNLPADKTQNHHGGSILLGDHIYMGHGHNNGFPLCMELESGDDAWRPGRGPGTGSAAIAYADGHLYFRYENGVMALIEATPEEYRLKGQFRIPINHGQSWSHPVIADGKLYLRDQHELVCFNIRKA
jgi:outer membrane protein assembly factor BamB